MPILGDLPLVGKLFTSESSQTTKKNLVIFVTPTIIDPAGNRAHTRKKCRSPRRANPVDAGRAVEFRDR